MISARDPLIFAGPFGLTPRLWESCSEEVFAGCGFSSSCSALIRPRASQTFHASYCGQKRFSKFHIVQERSYQERCYQDKRMPEIFSDDGHSQFTL